jgi:hypothetical protein
MVTILSRKGLFAIAAVVDVALQKDGQPIAAKTLAVRHGLSPRHLEAVLQAPPRGWPPNRVAPPSVLKAPVARRPGLFILPSQASNGAFGFPARL